jgi:predicted metal-binding membrane protein
VYVRGIKRDASGLVGTARTLSLAAGYLVVWSATAIGALTLTWSFDRLLENNPGALPWVGGADLVVAGVYQLSAIKRRCLARCRSPLSFALAASRHAGPFSDLKVGLEHGAGCVACCWALMVALVAVGAMSTAWMAVIAAVVLLERSWRHGGRWPAPSESRSFWSVCSRRFSTGSSPHCTAAG